jgi:nitrite reductase/ring-hydroxylating ferredoxin subunit
MLRAFIKIAKISDRGEGEMLAVTAEGEEVLVARVQGRYYAISNVCSHAYAWLDQGALRFITWEVQCPLHEGRFDVRTGEPTRGPPDRPVPAYAIRVEGEDILVGPPSD